eukprot:6213328-Pleurochrysis_carterae.AAC.2
MWTGGVHGICTRAYAKGSAAARSPGGSYASPRRASGACASMPWSMRADHALSVSRVARASAVTVHRARWSASRLSRAVDVASTAPLRTPGGAARLASSQASAYSCATAHGVPRTPRAASRTGSQAAPCAAARSSPARSGGTNATMTDPASAKRAEDPSASHWTAPRRGAATRCAAAVTDLRWAPVAPAASGEVEPKSACCWRAPAGTQTAVAPLRCVMGMMSIAGSRAAMLPLLLLFERGDPSATVGTAAGFSVGLAGAALPGCPTSAALARPAAGGLPTQSAPSSPSRPAAATPPPPARLWPRPGPCARALSSGAVASSARARCASPAPRADTAGMVPARVARCQTRCRVWPLCVPP